MNDIKLDPRYQKVVERILQIHGKARVARENKGLHVYFPSPECLRRDGVIEMLKSHGAVNLDRYFGEGKFAQLTAEERDVSGFCMKYSIPLKMSELLTMPPVTVRFPDAEKLVKFKASISDVDVREKQVCDAYGQWVPAPPGNVIPLTSLPSDHPAVVYCTSRGYNIERLVRDFSAGFCTQETPERTYRKYYRRGPNNWRDTPQCRLIIYGMIFGSAHAWQARILERYDETTGWKYFLHPDGFWDPVICGRDPHTGKERIRPDYLADPDRSWKEISKYRSADGMIRNKVVIGFDAALASVQGKSFRPVILCEGPLDAAKLGPPAVALTGKFVSIDQKNLLAKYFTHFACCYDNDEGGDQSDKYFEAAFSSMGGRHFRPPKHRKDLGECTQEEINQLREQMGLSPLN
jgi:hypothetical protein